jgi:hypothetical protein
MLCEVEHLQAPLARDDDVPEDDHRAEHLTLAIVNRGRRMLNGGLFAVAADEDVIAAQPHAAFVFEGQLRWVLGM